MRRAPDLPYKLRSRLEQTKLLNTLLKIGRLVDIVSRVDSECVIPRDVISMQHYNTHERSALDFCRNEMLLGQLQSVPLGGSSLALSITQLQIPPSATRLLGILSRANEIAPDGADMQLYAETSATQNCTTPALHIIYANSQIVAN